MYIDERLVAIGAAFGCKEELFADLAGRARALGLVGEEYLPALLEREREYPTGLDLPVPIAIAHIDTGVNRSFVSVATLASALSFGNMDGSEEELDVQAVFMFGIVDPDQQLEVLKRFARAFPQEDRIRALLDAPGERELIDELDGVLGGMLERGR